MRRFGIGAAVVLGSFLILLVGVAMAVWVLVSAGGLA